MMSKPENLLPLDPSFPRVIDLLPLLSLKCELDGDLEVGHFSGEASVSKTLSSTKEVNKDHDIFVDVVIGQPTKRRVQYRPPDYTSPKTLSTIYSEAEDMTGSAVPEVVEKSSLPIIPITKELEAYDELQGLDKIGYYQVGQGVFFNSRQRLFGLRGCVNPTRLITDDLRMRQLWQNSYARRLRSILKLQAVIGLDPEGRHKGWEELYPAFRRPEEGMRFPPFASAICNAYSKDRWWTDVGIPRRFLTLADGVTLEGYVYLLRNRSVRIPSA